MFLFTALIFLILIFSHDDDDLVVGGICEEGSREGMFQLSSRAVEAEVL